jgi:MFS family permease
VSGPAARSPDGKVAASLFEWLAVGRPFLLVWWGQTASSFTMAMTRFALGVWAYQNSGSITQYSMVVGCIFLPGFLIAPWAGSVVDRHDRRRVIMAADCVFVATSLVLGLLAASGRLNLFDVYAAGAVTSICQAFRLPAYVASTTLLAPKSQLGRAAGMTNLANSLAQIAAPAFAGPLLDAIGLAGVVFCNALGFAGSALILTAVRFPLPEISNSNTLKEQCKGSGDFIVLLGHLRKRPALMLLLVYCAVQSFVLMMALTLFTPMVLGAHSQIELGRILSAGSVGALAGSLIVVAFGTPRRLVATMLFLDIVCGVSVAASGVATQASSSSLALFTALFSGVIFQASAQTLWQRKIPLGLQGRMFVLESALTAGMTPVAALVGGLLAERVFEPAFEIGGWAALQFGAVAGVGKGAGIKFMFVVAGATGAIFGMAAFVWKRFRRLEQEFPDAH